MAKKTIYDFYSSRQNESREWKKPTDFDKLAKVFDELNREKIIALHKAGYTKQDGYSDVRETLSLVKPNIKPIGFCFYHTQDLERAIDPTKEIWNKYASGSIPKSFLIDKNGIIKYISIGNSDGNVDKLANEINKLLN